MDTIYIKALSIPTFIGILAWEQAVLQTVVLDIEMRIDAKAAAQEDNIHATVNYAHVAQRLIEFIGQGRFQLIETLAEQAAQLILKEFKVSWLRLTAAKPGIIPHAKEVGVCIERP